MSMYPAGTSPEAARCIFGDLILKLFFELDTECQENPDFALPEWITPTFFAAQQVYAIWNQAVDALLTDIPEKGDEVSAIELTDDLPF